MATAAFVAVYAIIASAVGMAYFAYCRWDVFLASHAIGGEARETLLLHLMLGAAAVGAAWPVGLVFLLYCVLSTRLDASAGRTPKRAPVL
jgi:hypothetical protein